MSQPPDDPHNNTTENSLWPPQWQGQRQNYPQQASAPNYPPPAYPPNLGPISQPGFTPPGYPPHQGSASSPGLTPPPRNFPQQGSAPNYPGQPQQQAFPPPGAYQQQGSAPNYPGQPPAWQGGLAPSPTPGAYPGQPQQQTFPSPGAYQQQAFPPPGPYQQPQQGGQYGSPPTWPNLVQPPQAPKKSKKGLIISIILLLILLAGGAGALLVIRGKNSNRPAVNASATTTTSRSTALPTQPGGTNPTTGNTGTVGQPIHAGANWVVTVAHVDETTSSDIPPDAGQTYMEINISLKNVSATSQVVSSILEFSLKDSSGRTYEEAKGIGDTNIKRLLDGSVAAGQTLNGQIPYEVPQSVHDFTLAFEYNLVDGSTASISWPIHV